MSIFATVRPHRNAAEDTLGRWVKEILNEAGIDMESYSPHSTRSTAATTALEQGVSLDKIMESAGWQSARTFYNHYHRPQNRVASEVPTAILSSKRKQTQADPATAPSITRKAKKDYYKKTLME